MGICEVKFLLLSTLIALAACSGEHGDLQDWMKEQQNEAAETSSEETSDEDDFKKHLA